MAAPPDKAPKLRAARKNNVIDTKLIGRIIAIPHRSDSTPSTGANRSLSIPTTSGPKPSPIRFNTRNKIAEVNARIEAGTKLCATATLGPRYVLCSDAHNPRQTIESVVSRKKSAPAPNTMESNIA